MFATPEQRRDKDNSHILEEGDVFALDVVVTTGSEPSFKTSEAPTTIYGRVGAAKYDLKLKTSRAVFSEIQKKAGHFPFSLRIVRSLELLYAHAHSSRTRTEPSSASRTVRRTAFCAPGKCSRRPSPRT